MIWNTDAYSIQTRLYTHTISVSSWLNNTILKKECGLFGHGTASNGWDKQIHFGRKVIISIDKMISHEWTQHHISTNLLRRPWRDLYLSFCVYFLQNTTNCIRNAGVGLGTDNFSTWELSPLVRLWHAPLTRVRANDARRRSVDQRVWTYSGRYPSLLPTNHWFQRAVAGHFAVTTQSVIGWQQRAVPPTVLSDPWI